MTNETTDEIQREFRRGMNSVDEMERGLRLPVGCAITEKSSDWFFGVCPVCRHTFREGDRVHLKAEGYVCHEDSALGCPPETDRTAISSDPGTVFEFLHGARSVWATSEQRYLYALGPDDPLVAQPADHFGRHICSVCGHTLRAGEIVLICPCAAHEGRNAGRCLVAVHHDPLHGLYCYGDWRPRQFQLHCPATLRKIGG